MTSPHGPRPEPEWVPKVHPLERPAETDDPLELMAQSVVGDPDVMLECLLQEFAWMGYGAGELLGLFHHPGYPVLGQLREYFGDAELERRVRALAARWGVLRFSETLAPHDEECDEEFDDADPAPPLVQITLPPRSTVD